MEYGGKSRKVRIMVIDLPYIQNSQTLTGRPTSVALLYASSLPRMICYAVRCLIYKNSLLLT